MKIPDAIQRPCLSAKTIEQAIDVVMATGKGKIALSPVAMQNAATLRRKLLEQRRQDRRHR